MKTTICTKCNDTGLITRYINTSRYEGEITLRYTPRKTKTCNCIKTVKDES
jgi:hypothetical protein